MRSSLDGGEHQGDERGPSLGRPSCRATHVPHRAGSRGQPSLGRAVSHNGLSSRKRYEVRTDDGGHLIRAAYV
jgi:hypothetical protein